MTVIVIDTSTEEYQQRLEQARKRAAWELGDESWGGQIVGAFLWPDDDARALEREMES